MADKDTKKKVNKKEEDEDRVFGFIDTRSEARNAMLVTDIACLVIIVLAVMIVARFFMNAVFLSEYNKGNYNGGIPDILKVGNINEGYLPYYNSGNVHYQKGEYDEAIVDYNKALNHYIPEGKECDIRVNLALAMLQKIDFDHIDHENQKEVKKVISQLLAAREVLTEQGCADPKGTDGHDPEAEQLKQDIDKMIKELMQDLDDEDQDDQDQNQDDQNDQDQDQDQNQDGNSGGSNSREKEIQEQLNDQKRENMQERNDTQNEMNEQRGNNDDGGGGEDQGGSGGNQWNGKTW